MHIDCRKGNSDSVSDQNHVKNAIPSSCIPFSFLKIYTFKRWEKTE